jgi:AraC-like DNA-binding protein
MPGISELRNLLDRCAKRGVEACRPVIRSHLEPPAQCIYNTAAKLLLCADPAGHAVALPEKLLILPGQPAWFAPGTWHRVERGHARRYLALADSGKGLRVHARWYKGGSLGLSDRVSLELTGPGAEHAAALVRAGQVLADRPPALARLARVVLDASRVALAQVQEEANPIDSARATWQQCVAVLEEHLGRGLPRDALARRVGIHPGYFSALFARFAGKSFARYRNELRISRARSLLLAQPCLRIGRVGQLVGIEDPRYFRRLFRRVVGMSPSAYRRGLLS